MAELDSTAGEAVPGDTPTSTEQASIRVAHVDKLYHKRQRRKSSIVHVLHDIDLTIKPGEFVCLLGPSGCGKTTLLKCIDGLVPIEGGEIRVSGHRITGPGPDRAFVFQNFGLFPWRNVLGNVTLPLESLGQSREQRQQTARKYIDMVGLSKFIDRHPHELSGGMQQRVGIARALALDPQILLMDEPFGALDAQTRELMQVELLRIWQDTGKTVVFVTHSVDEALFLSQRIVVMSSGPGMISKVIEVPFGFPRNEAIKKDPSYAEMRHDIWELLAVSSESSFSD